MTTFENSEQKTQLINKLKEQKLCILFKKLNNDTRKMNCTLMENHLPPASKSDPISKKLIREISPNVIVVWDIDKKSWRSMRWENILEVIDAE